MQGYRGAGFVKGGGSPLPKGNEAGYSKSPTHTIKQDGQTQELTGDEKFSLPNQSEVYVVSLTKGNSSLPEQVKVNLDLAEKYLKKEDYGNLVISLHQAKIGAKALGIKLDQEISSLVNGLEENIKQATNSALDGDIPSTSSYVTLSLLHRDVKEPFLKVAQDANYLRTEPMRTIDDEL